MTSKTRIPILPQTQSLPTQFVPPQYSTTQSSSVMAGAQPNRMNVIVSARYSPLILPQVLKELVGGDYKRDLPRFNRQGEVTTEEHQNAYFSYADNQNIEHEYL